jgi:predicted nucleotidyltransferase
LFYLDLFGALERHGVRYVVVGGLALNLHGVERATMDVDLALALEATNLRNAIDAFRSLGLVPIAPVALDDAADPAKLAEWRAGKHMVAFGLRSPRAVTPHVDFLIDVPVPFVDLAARAVVKVLGTLAVPVASIDDLIALKRHAGRAIDLADIEALQRLRQLGL